MAKQQKKPAVEIPMPPFLFSFVSLAKLVQILSKRGRFMIHTYEITGAKRNIDV